MKIEVTQTYDDIKIKFDGVLHASINLRKLLGIQAWRTNENNFSIEYNFENEGKMICEYDSEHKWGEILLGLEKIALPT